MRCQAFAFLRSSLRYHRSLLVTSAPTRLAIVAMRRTASINVGWVQPHTLISSVIQGTTNLELLVRVVRRRQ